jgi:predicted Na+-dependent transporter
MSNIICFLVRADLDLSVAMTTASSFCAIFMMPLNIFLYVKVTGLSDDVSLDYLGIVASALLVVAGLGGGIWIKKWAATSDSGPTVCKWVGKIGALGGLGVVVSGLVANAGSDTPIWGATGAIYGSACFQVTLGICMGFGFSLLAGLRKPSCVAVSIETSVQNAVLAMAIISISFDGDDAGEAAVVPMAYMMFSTWTNVLWGFLSWKVFGLTDLPKGATFAEILKSYKASLAVGNAESDSAGMNEALTSTAESGI